MCGRYTVTSAPEAVRALFRYQEQPNFPPRYNVAPSQPIPIVRLVDGKRHFALVRWGLLPSWVKDPKTFTLLINARGESAAEKPAFRAAMKRRRCLIPADGFYEWQKAGERKRPFYVRAKKGGPMAFAGLWETWTDPNGEELETATIVTTAANKTLAPIHDRMPVIVPPDGFDLWLDTANVDAKTAAALIAPAPENLLEAFEISTAVNRVANDNPKLLEPVTPGQLDTAPAKPAAKNAPAKRAKKNDGQASLF
jgi:putative SOS response-associated peptidase YedK